MLTVGVHLHRARPPAALGEPEARLQRATDPEVVRQLDDIDSRGAGHVGGAVAAPVADHDDIEVGHDQVQLGEHARQRLLLVERGNDGDRPHRRTLGHQSAPLPVFVVSVPAVTAALRTTGSSAGPTTDPASTPKCTPSEERTTTPSITEA